VKAGFPTELPQQLLREPSFFMTVTVTRKKMQGQNQQEFFRRLDRTLARRYVHEYLLGREQERRLRITSNEDRQPPTRPEFWQPRYVVSVIIEPFSCLP
jgi:hypothetical protein